MIVAREEQTKEKLVDVTQSVANDLAQVKGYNITTKPFPDFEKEFFANVRPSSLLKRFETPEEIASLVFVHEEAAIFPNIQG